MKRFQVLITDRFDVSALAKLKADARLDVKIQAEGSFSDVEALLIRSRTKITRDLLATAPHLKVVITATSGFDHIDLEATLERDIKVMHTPSANSASAAELTWALILACKRKLLLAHQAVKAGDWRRESLMAHELCGKTIGIVGLGRIGSRVARIAQAFGMKTIGFDPYLDHFPEAVSRVSFEELLKLSDIMSFHVPATSETRHMLTARHMEEMNHACLLINTSRGHVVRERDLVTALENEWLGGAGLDVFEREPLSRDSKLLTFSNVTLSPHVGALTEEAFHQASNEAAEKLIAFVDSGLVTDSLPPDAPWFEAGFRAT